MTASQFPTGPQVPERAHVSGSDTSMEVVVPVRDVTRAERAPQPGRTRTLVYLFADRPDAPGAFPVTHDATTHHATTRDATEHGAAGARPVRDE
ncbi:hypothetical protein [Motilibacter deserti]|uniref:Uncharacterized protein n=1 Tax=Motilibacter deserti TaxID=2714956 RepID=A0ABX0GQV2_9ACTN|nr:hypothetical protein [Motilibacter deserti]NHC13102.1 hypothetical protein [Motilibacter deserti]